MRDLKDRSFVVFGPPAGREIPLEEMPRLESWDAKEAPSQQKLRAYLDTLERLLKPEIAAATGELGLFLNIGLPEHTDLLARGRDLDNFLFPVTRHFGPHRFASAQAAKRIGKSSIRIGPATPRPWEDLSADWNFVSVVTERSTATRAWKESLVRQIATEVTAPAPAGPLAVEICYRVGPMRNWAMLWKPTIDSMGVILGEPENGRPFHPYDDHIVQLGLHRVIDPTLHNRVELGILWKHVRP